MRQIRETENWNETDTFHYKISGNLNLVWYKDEYLYTLSKYHMGLYA